MQKSAKKYAIGICLLGLTGLFFTSSCAQKTKPPEVKPTATTEADVAQVMGKPKQLTFVGPRAGEGYFSADGKRMIFQSERTPTNPFYQIYLMDLTTGATELVSTGAGKTTCSWIHPTQNKVLFSSTHLDPNLKKKEEEEWATRKAAQKSKYSWSYDETYDIFEKDLKTGKLIQRTKEKGYDAESSWSPDGKYIVFASNRAGYLGKLNAEDQKLFEQDPSYMMDIYIMNADGQKVRRLTDVKGYDGGPFFSADGKKITWRRFSPNGQWAEIMTMNVDGSEPQQLTHMKAMSWAPYYHPSGDYLIFTTNKEGFTNFELYIVDAKGTQEPVRVSFLPDFDGLPVFSPDGQKLSWTHRNAQGESQIYITDWNDNKARQLLKLPLAGVSTTKNLSLNDLQPEIIEKDVQSIIGYLASPEMNGRRSASPEEKIYSQTLANLFKEMGLATTLSEFEFTSDVELGSSNSLSIQMGGEKLNPLLETDFIPLSISKVGSFSSAPIVFAGYGIVAPASEKESEYNSYANTDVKNKWVLIFRDIPEEVPNSKRLQINLFSRLQHKVLMAKQRGAIGVLIVRGPNGNPTNQLMKLKYEGVSAETTLPVLNISNDLADKILKSSGRTLKQWQDVLDKGEVQVAELPKTSVQATVSLNFKKSKGLNVIAKLAVKNAKETIVIGAHGDHLGHGEMGSSLAKGDEQGQIHLGADDNASGVAGVVELAHRLATLHRLGKIHLNKNIIFAVWSGEEIGILGSTHWVKNQKSEKISTYLNMDMIGRLREQLSVQGAGSAKEWKGLLEELSSQSGLRLAVTEDPYLPTDSMAFYMQDIPGLNFFTGAHLDYHTPRDRAELINAKGEVEILGIIEKLTLRLATTPPEGFSPVKLTYIKSESSKSQLQGRSFRVYLGTIPDYTQEGIKGVKISGTSKDSPAEKAGLKAGDVIIELSGLKIENLYDYVYGLQSLKANQPTAMKIQRQGKIEVLSITPIQKE